MSSILYPGSFDPITLGHMDIIERSAAIWDEVIVAVLLNPSKKGFFSVDRRIALITESCGHLSNVKIKQFDGLLINFAKQESVFTIVRGARDSIDFEHEVTLARGNAALDQRLETVLLPSSAKYMHISSSVVREIAHFGGDLSSFVPPCVAKSIANRL